MAQGDLDVEPELNKLCPQVTTTSVEEFVKKYWV